ncbi:MAG TPA: hypothetical protein VN493_25715 [Thermoanaerobaculia bacterium]|nr:hypothetical protein [Thermoanaerobaculia bacterium]
MKNTLRFAFATALLLSLAAVPAFAYGPLAVCNPGQPFLWPNGGTNIPYNPDQGDLGPLNNAGAVALLGTAFGAWDAIPTATTTYLNAGPLPEDVDITNFLPYLEPVAPDGLSAIVFDDTGEIFDLLFGPGSGVLGFAGPEWVDFSDCSILEGLSFLNGPAFDDAAAALDVIVHEFGHYQNLAHTVVNGQILLGDNSGPTPNDTFPIPPLAGLIETMYPFYFGVAAGTSTPHADDIAGLSTLYPAPGFAAATATIAGRILGPNGTTPLTGVNVIARNVANPFADAVSAISSDFAIDYTPGQPFVGVYTIRGLTPGAQYAVYVDEILAGGFSTPPLFPLPGPEEFYNGAAESNNGGTDVPTAFTPVSAAAGGTASNINIIFNAPAPGAPLPVGDDGSVQLFLPFTFQICNQPFDAVFVNANGNLTFGAASGDFSESTDEFLAGPPRIAGLWDDLNPGAGGTVVFAQTSNTFTVTYTNVPEFPATGANTFSIKLSKSSNHVDINYGTLTAADGLAGVSCGGAITSRFERPSNQSAENGRQDLKKEPAAFELFGPGNPVDLSNDSLKFNAKAKFSDEFENNDTLNKAEDIKLPFTTEEVDDFTEIRPDGDDVDYFEFKMKAGEFLAVEVVRSNLDTVLGVFDAETGDLLITDDDGGDGLLSRLLLQFNEDLEVAIAVSTFPDFDFDGVGGAGAGRYVLGVHKYKGTLLAAGDDTSTPVTFPGFSFPYQGTNWGSVFVNSNGNLTFGAGNTDFSETVPEFLAGPPMIAPRWDDFDATFGLVIAEEDNNDDLTIHFVSVPEFFSTSPNYFSVKLDEDGEIDIEYFATSRTDGLSGITQGGGAADPGEEDLSEDDDHSATGTTYELFAADVFTYDLFYTDLEFEKHGHGHGDDDDDDDDDDD